MSEFIKFKQAIQKQLDMMVKHNLFIVDVEKDTVWDTYLSSFPEGTNPLFRERTTHDCQCCKQFIRAIGNVVAVVNNKLVSIWDIQIDTYHQEVADALSNLVKSAKIKEPFYHFEKKAGTDYNFDGVADIKWDHFYYELPEKFVNRDPGSIVSQKRADKEVFKRSLDEITLDTAEIVLELIEQNSLYRGKEHRQTVKDFIKYKKQYKKVKEKDNWCWDMAAQKGSVIRYKNAVIGTLLSDISDGVELDRAVASFESKVAPQNYKRPTALVTKKMVENAQKKVVELGLEDSLHRRFATKEDITINNVLFADREVKKAMNAFEELIQETPNKPKNLKKIEEVSADTFFKDVLPKAESIEIMVENKHENNLVSLIAPVYLDSKHLFKWNNNFSWAYNGEVTDSIKERVKNAGGNVEGVLRWSLSWFNYDDLDIHVREPDGNHIEFRNKGKIHPSSGRLDVDMNAGGGNSREAVENVTWTDKYRMQEGVYEVWVHNFCKRENKDVGFTVEMEYDGSIKTFNYDKAVRDEQNVVVAKFNFSKKDGIKFVSSLPSTDLSQEIWGVNTQNFHKVSMVMASPNHWDEQEIGNKHYFFMLENCVNPDRARGFFNEFLNGELTEHRKVLEVLSSKMKTEESEEQLSGLGFSTTQRNQLICKVSGKFNRIIKVNF